MEAPVARVSSPVRNSRHRDSATVQLLDSIIILIISSLEGYGAIIINIIIGGVELMAGSNRALRALSP